MTDALPITDAMWHAFGDCPIPWKERHRWRLAPEGMGEGALFRWVRDNGFDRVYRIGPHMLVRQPQPPPRSASPWPGLEGGV